MPRSHRSGADGVARSASPIGRSLNRRPARPRFRRADHPGAPASIKLSRYPSSPNEQKQNAHEEIAFADEQKRNAHEEIPFADEQKQMLTGKSLLLTSKSKCSRGNPFC